MRTEADAINRHIGDRLRILREKHGLSQRDLSAALDISFQQMGNYEKGKHRLSAGALFLLARFLGTSPAAFFEGLSPAEPGFAEDAAGYAAAAERAPQSIKLDAAFGRIRSQRDRALAVAIVETIATARRRSGLTAPPDASRREGIAIAAPLGLAFILQGLCEAIQGDRVKPFSPISWIASSPTPRSGGLRGGSISRRNQGPGRQLRISARRRAF